MSEHNEAEWTKNEEQTRNHEETNISLEEQTSNPLDDTEKTPVLEETKIHEKEKVTPTNTDTAGNTYAYEITENPGYLEGKEQDHQDIVSLVEITGAESADLRMRKDLIGLDFPQLLKSYDCFILNEEPISTIGKTNLIGYFTYELLEPLNDIDLERSNSAYDTWKTRHLPINYTLNGQNGLAFSLVLPTIDQRYQVESMSLLGVSPETMEINVQDGRMFSLIRHWSVDRVFSAEQIAIFNHKLNQLLAHAGTLDFAVNQTLLDNTKPLRLNLQSEFKLTNEVLDGIFIVAMKDPSYDMEKINKTTYQVRLNKGQSLTITTNEKDQTILSISSGDYPRSVIDFFINYELLVPLMVKKS